MFAIAFVTVQFGAIAYSSRLVVMFADSSTVYHALGIFFSTFVYLLVGITWTGRNAAGWVPLL